MYYVIKEISQGTCCVIPANYSYVLKPCLLIWGMSPQPSRVKYLYTVTHSPLIISANRCTHEVEICLCASDTNPMCIMTTCTIWDWKLILLKRKWKLSVLCNKLLCKNLDHLYHLLYKHWMRFSAAWIQNIIFKQGRGETFPRTDVFQHAQPVLHNQSLHMNLVLLSRQLISLKMPNLLQEKYNVTSLKVEIPTC